MKRNEALTHGRAWKDLEDVMCSERTRHKRPHSV
jgi:hypothetical protein